MSGSYKSLEDFNSEKETLKFAKDLGSRLKGGEIIELVGDMGSGKTTFVRGLVKGAGGENNVTSPTFTIQQKYEGPITICHYDFYRLHNAGILSHELHETAGKKDMVIVVEWAKTINGVLSGVLSKDRVRIEIVPTGDSSRRFSITIPKSLRYLS